jgi:hypothetical protein
LEGVPALSGRRAWEGIKCVYLVIQPEKRGKGEAKAGSAKAQAIFDCVCYHYGEGFLRLAVTRGRDASYLWTGFRTIAENDSGGVVGSKPVAKQVARDKVEVEEERWETLSSNVPIQGFGNR